MALRPGLAPTELDVVGRPLVRTPRAAYAAHAYVAKHGLPTTPADMAHHGLVHFDRGGPPTLPGQVSLRVDSMLGMAMATAAGLGIGLLPTFIGDHHAGLRRLFMVDAGADIRLWLLIHADLRQTARVRAFVDFLTDAVKADAALFDGTATSAA